MAANVRYRATYYNTTGTSVTSVIEILDTEAVAQIINVETSGSPNESFEGLTQDLKPGIYPTSLKFGIYLRSSPKVRNGVTYGPSIGLLTDISSSAEGRFLARYKRDGVIHFVGPIIWDQSSYTDEDNPLLSITAVDGMSRWQTTDYISEVGQLRYWSRTDRIGAYSNATLSYNGPTVGVSVIVLEHSVTTLAAGLSWEVVTTWVYREIYSIASPGTGWVDQTQGRWCKAVSYTNETITEDLSAGQEKYNLTRDIDDEKQRPVSEYFERAIAETNMTGEYISPAVMYDTNVEWREHSMGAGDPCTLTRLPEDPFIGKTWADVIQEICRLFFLRAYYSKGRYHFEQISTRDDSTFTRYTYQSDGTLIGTETASLDLNFDTLDIMPGVGGIYKFLAPFRSVEARVTLDTGNLLEGINWGGTDYGEKYIGRIKKVAGDHKLFINTTADITSTFDPTTLLLYPQSYINLICEHDVACIYSIRIRNINTATTYYLQYNATFYISQFDFISGTWELDFSEFSAPKIHFGGPDKRFTTTKYGHTVERKFAALAETLPGSTDDMYDIFISYRPVVEFTSAVGALSWVTLHTNKFWTTANTRDNILRFYSYAPLPGNFNDWEEVQVDAELVYMSENDVDNSIKVKMELQWADTGQPKKRIEIYTGTVWQGSSAWSIGGIGTPVAIGELLVTEIMSLRTLPRKLYSGSYLSTLPNSETRFQRGTSFYLPLSCNKDSDVDLFQGEFLEINRSTPPDVTTIESPIAGEPLPGLTEAIPPEDTDIALYFETNEAITSGSTLTDVDIINTLGSYVASGETISIIHPTSGVSENLTLTAEILPGDTIIYFESNVMANSYPDASYIVLQDGGVSIESGGSKYRYDNRLYNGATHTIPVALLDLAVLDGLSNQHLNNKVWVWRNGQKLIGIDYTTIGLLGGIYWWYDSGTNQIKVHADFEYVDEYLGIDIDLNR